MNLVEVVESVHAEMLSATAVFNRQAVAACAEICEKRLQWLHEQLQRSFEEERRHIGTPGVSGSLPSSRHASLARSIRQRLDAQGETLADFFRTRAAVPGRVSRVDFIAALSVLNLGVTQTELSELFNSIVKGTTRDATVFEIVAALDLSALTSTGPSVQLIGSTAPCAGQLPYEAERVLQRAQTAVSRSGRSAEEVFHGFCRTTTSTPGRKVMSVEDLQRVLCTFEPNLSSDIVHRLWNAMVPATAVGLDFPTFRAWFCPAASPFSGGLGAGSGAMPRLDAWNSPALCRQPVGTYACGVPSSVPGKDRLLSPSLYDRPPVIGAPVGMGLEQTLAPGDAMRFSAPAVLQAAVGTQPPAPVLPDEKAILGSLYRMKQALAKRGTTVDSLFVLHDTNMDKSVGLTDGFLPGCEQCHLPLSRSELDTLFHRLARSTIAGQAPRLYFADLEAELNRVPENLSDAQFAREYLGAVDAKAKSAGRSLEAEFAALGQHLTDNEIQSVLMRLNGISQPQWVALAPLMEKLPDGRIPWRNFLRWAGLSIQPDVPAVGVNPLQGCAGAAAVPPPVPVGRDPLKDPLSKSSPAGDPLARSYHGSTTPAPLHVPVGGSVTPMQPLQPPLPLGPMVPTSAGAPPGPPVPPPVPTNRDPMKDPLGKPLGPVQPLPGQGVCGAMDPLNKPLGSASTGYGTGAGMAPAASPLPPSSSTDPLAPRPLTPLPPTGSSFNRASPLAPLRPPSSSGHSQQPGPLPSGSPGPPPAFGRPF